MQTETNSTSRHKRGWNTHTWMVIICDCIGRYKYQYPTIVVTVGTSTYWNGRLQFGLYRLPYTLLLKDMIYIAPRWLSYFRHKSTRSDTITCYALYNDIINTIFQTELVVPIVIYWIRVITILPNSEQSYKGKVKTHKYKNRQNQSTIEGCW